MNGDRSGAKSHLREACNTDHASRSTLFTLLDVCSFDSSIAGYSSSFSYWIGLPPALSHSLASLARLVHSDGPAALALGKPAEYVVDDKIGGTHTREVKDAVVHENVLQHAQ